MAEKQQEIERAEAEIAQADEIVKVETARRAYLLACLHQEVVSGFAQATIYQRPVDADAIDRKVVAINEDIKKSLADEMAARVMRESLASAGGGKRHVLQGQ